MHIETELEKTFGDFGALIGAWGAEKATEPALADSRTQLTWREVAELTARIAAQLQRDDLSRVKPLPYWGPAIFNMHWYISRQFGLGAALRP
jgi:hypothetical protein